MSVGCQIWEYLGPIIASLKHHQAIQSPQIAKALNEDMYNFPKGFSQPKTWAAAKEMKAKHTSDPAALLLLSFRGLMRLSEVQNLLSKMLPETLMLGSMWLSAQGLLRHKGKWSLLPRREPSPNGAKEDFPWPICPVQTCSCCTVCREDYLALSAWAWDQCQEWFSQDLLFISSDLINYLSFPKSAGCVSLAVKKKKKFSFQEQAHHKCCREGEMYRFLLSMWLHFWKVQQQSIGAWDGKLGCQGGRWWFRSPTAGMHKKTLGAAPYLPSTTLPEVRRLRETVIGTAGF